MGLFHLWIARHLYSFRPRHVLIANGQQTLGVELPWGIAASLARPTEKILSISGGGFLFSAMELETAVRQPEMAFTEFTKAEWNAIKAAGKENAPFKEKMAAVEAAVEAAAAKAK